MSFLARYASVRAGNPAGGQYSDGTQKRRAGQPMSGCAPRQVTCTMYASGIIRACQADSLCAMIAARQNESFSGKRGRFDPARNNRAASLPAAESVRFLRRLTDQPGEVT
jgi:hypothetical protein